MIPYVRKIDFEYGRVDALTPLIRRVIAKNPSPFSYVGTGTYIVGHGEVAVIDPGPELADHYQALQAALKGETVSAIVVTHHHIDHSPLAAQLQAETGAPIYGCAVKTQAVDDSEVKTEAANDLSFHPDVSLCDGGRIAGPGWTLKAIPTPGHTSNHICYALLEENACFTGDHIMGWSTTVITPPDGDMTDYMKSLDRIQARGFATLWPTHGPPITEPHGFIDAYIAHRRQREAQILGALKAGPAQIGEMVPGLYADVDPGLWPAAGRSVLAHLIDLVRRGVVTSEGPPGPQSVFRLVGPVA
jgi:glyoxylase-like metal-dependent hydrolase (beta-lactamase superfamily II)